MRNGRHRVSLPTLVALLEKELSKRFDGRNVAGIMLHIEVRPVRGSPNWRIKAGEGMPTAALEILLSAVSAVQSVYDLDDLEYARLLKAPH